MSKPGQWRVDPTVWPLSTLGTLVFAFEKDVYVVTLLAVEAVKRSAELDNLVGFLDSKAGEALCDDPQQFQMLLVPKGTSAWVPPGFVATVLTVPPTLANSKNSAHKVPKKVDDEMVAALVIPLLDGDWCKKVGPQMKVLSEWVSKALKHLRRLTCPPP